jgi:hypothetical protein
MTKLLLTVIPGESISYSFLVPHPTRTGPVTFSVTGEPEGSETVITALGRRRYVLSLLIPHSAPAGLHEVNLQTRMAGCATTCTFTVEVADGREASMTL